MKKNNQTSQSNFRQKAEELLKIKKASSDSLSSQETQPFSHSSSLPINLTETEMLKLIHEFELHQIELELQNEELIIENERDKTRQKLQEKSLKENREKLISANKQLAS
ncbi:MAG: hypothetical protein NT004_10930, partial [Bacteroidetes bacterium]|nr:hypothetical protein [Bacteroidota bacterium]